LTASRFKNNFVLVYNFAVVGSAECFSFLEFLTNLPSVERVVVVEGVVVVVVGFVVVVVVVVEVSVEVVVGGVVLSSSGIPVGTENIQ